jgi:VanZ family protein
MKYVCTIFISALILIAVLIPGPNLPDINLFFGFDKFVHLSMFGAWALAFRYDSRRSPFSFLIAFTAGMSFSLVTEILQLFVEERSFDLADLLADAVGLIIGLVVSSLAFRLLKR